MIARIVVPMVPPSGNVLRRKYRNPHAYARLREIWASNIFHLLASKDRGALRQHAAVPSRCRVKITVEHKRLYDNANLHSGIKPVEDCLTNLGLIRDDSAKWIDETIEQIKGPNAQTTIEIETL